MLLFWHSFHWFHKNLQDLDAPSKYVSINILKYDQQFSLSFVSCGNGLTVWAEPLKQYLVVEFLSHSDYSRIVKVTRPPQKNIH